MDPDLRARAESLLAEAASAHGLADPRGPYRERLRALKDTHNEAFRRAVAHYESVVLPALASGDDALPIWLEYGRFLGSLTSEGNLSAIDASGRARNFAPPVGQGELVLHLPDDDAADVLIALQPLELSDAQRATIDLLVHRRNGTVE